jgi:hypothetical protein
MKECNCDCHKKDEKIRPITGGYIERGASQIEIERHVLEHIRNGLIDVPDNVVKDQKPGHIKVSERDLKAIEDEFWFKLRFGFTLGPRGRIAMFDAIDQYDLSDAEVRRLRRAGCIKWDGHTLRIRSSKSMLVAGYFYLVLLAPLVAVPFVAMLWGANIPLLARVALGAISAVFGSVAYIVYDVFIAQYQLGKRKRDKKE